MSASGCSSEPSTPPTIASAVSLVRIFNQGRPPQMHCWLRPGGVLVGTVGAVAWSGHEDNWLSSGAPMWWSHADAATYRRWFTVAGFTIDEDEFVPEGDSGHQLLVASAAARRSS
jgi:hypothetical protein